jgi:hypothetical protein
MTTLILPAGRTAFEKEFLQILGIPQGSELEITPLADGNFHLQLRKFLSDGVIQTQNGMNEVIAETGTPAEVAALKMSERPSDWNSFLALLENSDIDPAIDPFARSAADNAPHSRDPFAGWQE